MERAFLAIFSAYLLGSVPFAYLITRWRTGLDIRYLGDGNVGARNVLHTVGTRWGILVGVLDLGKGFAVYSLVQWLASPHWAVLLAGFAAVLGHGFPIFLRGQGGKGVATTLGFLLGLMPWATLLGMGLLVLINLLLREFNISLAVGVAAMILLGPLFGYGVWSSLYALTLFLALWGKKAIDLPRERMIWAQNPWQDGAKPDWYPGASTAQETDKKEYSSSLQQ
jgi:glycerol-3-phosphate acyltransferase PlsY